jgi:hypothetical protein
MIQKSPCAWRLQYNHKVYRNFLIILYNTMDKIRSNAHFYEPDMYKWNQAVNQNL